MCTHLSPSHRRWAVGTWLTNPFNHAPVREGSPRGLYADTAPAPTGRRPAEAEQDPCTPPHAPKPPSSHRSAIGGRPHPHSFPSRQLDIQTEKASSNETLQKQNSQTVVRAFRTEADSPPLSANDLQQAVSGPPVWRLNV